MSERNLYDTPLHEGRDNRGRKIDPGVLALILLACLVLALIAGFVSALATHNPYAAIWAGGSAFIAFAGLAIAIYKLF
jgi:hypothetical protein